MTLPLALIIEDDPNLGAIFTKTLQGADFETLLDPDGDRYSDLLANRKPALVLLDLHLPAVTGRQILDDLRSRYPALPVLIVTADLYQAKALSASGETVLIKPISPSRLVEVTSKIAAAQKDS